MKWLRKYKESLDDILDLTKDTLAYLLDGGRFQIGSSTNLAGTKIITVVMIQSSTYGNYFSFQSIKEDIIPLINILQYRYDDIELELVQRNFSIIKVDITKLEVVKYNSSLLRSIIIKIN